MSLAAPIQYIDPEDYLLDEQSRDIRHEYVAGELFAMAGAGEVHNRIAGNLFFHIRLVTRGTPCGVFMTDMKVRVDSHDAFYYPDVVLTCDPEDGASLYKSAPCFIAEVLSPSTESIDRREKLIAYRTLEALRYYLLVSQTSRRVECYERDESGVWGHRVLEADGELSFVCGDRRFVLTLADLYEDVVLVSRA
ncbi:Uma2 family endonuclease [Thiocystis violacea]|uniref:Uma2 family endonuclease n=1 Tax=Thiocystis violacea TaxID=13725 RepID=UPI0019031023|nr:Uma2 family endonuclease [Thiocystis violacea]MBK1718035.1 hypothetical protein [Thiocystis violacea]